MKCFYHKSDHDGRCSAAIIYNKFGNMCEFIGVDYYDKFPFEDINIGETIIMVDYSLSPEYMYKLSCMDIDLIWIDHHSFIINESDNIDMDFSNLKGIRDINFAACELTWKYFYNEPVPYSVKLLSLFDSWKWREISCDKNVYPFEYGLKLQDTRVKSKLWLDLFNSDKNSKLIKNIVDDGNIIIKYNEYVNKSIIKNHSYEILFDGKYKSLVVNSPNATSLIFDSIDSDKYDLLIIFSRKEKLWKINLYSSINSDIDVSKIAYLYGGGGHKNSAAFFIDNIQILIKKNENNFKRSK